VERKRFDEIDFLRFIGIIGIIAIHILTYSLTGFLNKFLWNNLQFVVIFFPSILIIIAYQMLFKRIKKII